MSVPDSKISKAVSQLVVAAMILSAFACGRTRQQEPAFPVQPVDVPRVLVIPFENMGDGDDSFLVAGMTNGIKTRLAAVHGLGFVSGVDLGAEQSARPAAGVIARQIGVDFVLEGSVLFDQTAQLSQQLYVESRLVRASDGELLWSDQVVRPLADVFSIQSAISQAVVDNMGVEIDADERRALDARPSENLEAYQEYLRGIAYSWSYERKELKRAELHLSQAVTLDPNFAVAHAALSENHSLTFHFGYDRSPQRLAGANAAAQRANDIDPRLPEAHRARGFYYYWGQRNYELALSEFSLAAHARPNDPSILDGIGLVLRRQGRWQEAVDAFQRAVAIEPENHDILLDLASPLSRVRRYGEAIETCRRAMELVPDKIYSYVHLSQAFVHRDGSLDEARRVLEAMPEKDPAQQVFYRYEQALLEREFDQAMSALADVDDMTSDPIDEIKFTRSLAECECSVVGSLDGSASEACHRAREYFEQACNDSPADPSLQAALGWTYALIGENEKAIEAGRRAVELTPITTDAMSGHTYLVMLAKIYARADEPYLAVKTIYTALTTPGMISVASLELDPDWDPIRDDPRFHELLRMHGETESTQP
jgi:serine/threonine-protein kinase